MSTNQNLMQHMRELIDRIKAADVAYYRDDNPTMTDREYDLLVDELKELETTTGLILSGSPTQTVSGEILKELTLVRHTRSMLSADKTKSVDEMLRFANGRPVVLSWKLDGLTLVLRYEGGEFKQAITRGREGIIGEDVTHTVRTFMNVPMCIPCTDKFEVRGEGVISWAHFEKINLSLSEPYSHPRNLAAGSVRMLDARESGKRYLEFFAFDLISDSIEEQSKTAQLQFLAENGFDVVPYVYNGEPYCYDVIGIIGIYLDGVIPCQKEMKEIGSIGVDAGLAGFFHNKPDYTDDEWAAFCDRVRHGDAWLIKEGFYSSSGYGDGCYGVYAYEQGGEITAIEIRFL